MTIDTTALLWFLLDVSLRACGAAVAAAVVLKVLDVRAAAVRHTVWTTVLAAMLLMPVLPSVVPALPLPAVPRLAPAAEEILPPQPAVAARPVPSQPAPAGATPPSVAPAGLDARASIGPEQVRSSAARASWPLALAIMYIAGALFFLGRLARGWRLVAGLLRRVRKGGAVRLPSDLATSSGLTAGVYQSSEVVAPFTAGIVRPMVILPAVWTKWTPDVLAAVIAHEMAHLRRRDALVLLVARINRAVFWFHPLAWWLERQLAVTAEHACDEAATAAVPEPRRYAEILVEMADAVRRHRGRVAWPAVGVDGAGALEGRIDRVLRGSFARTSRARASATVVMCAAAIALVVACRQDTTTAPLREDPELAKRLARQDENVRKSEAARDMTQAQADELEKKLETNPQDFDARRQLVTYYSQSSTVAWDTKVRGLRRHALWLIEHHPEHDVRPPALSPQYDPEGFAAAKKLWEAHLAKAEVSPFLVYRAASFFLPSDKPFAEQLILRGMKMDPESKALAARMEPNVGGYQWDAQLATLYASALRGSESAWGTYNDLRTREEFLRSPYAEGVRAKLAASADARLLARVGNLMIRVSPTHYPPGPDRDRAQALTQRVRDEGIGYLQRASQIDPTLESAKASLFRVSAAKTMNEADRLANRAHERFTISEDITEHSKKDPAAAAKEREEARREAQQVLDMAKDHPGDAAYSSAVVTARHVLASIALRDGDRKQALLHLRESVKVPPSDQLKYTPPYAWLRLVNRLLKEGERQSVVEFLEAYAQLTVGQEQQRLLDDAKSIREGRMPTAYQHAAYRETAPSPFKPRK